MDKKLMALAVASALAAPAAAFAQASNVTIYGRANLGLDNYSATGATLGSSNDLKARNRVYDAGSRLGFMGSEDLGNGLKAVFLMETGVNVDTGNGNGQGGAANPFTGTFSSRIGHVGLQGNWGLLTFGKSNVWWGNGSIEQTGASYLASAVGVFNGSFGRGMNVLVQRVSNVVQYTSPVMSGVVAQVSYSPNSETSGANGNTDGNLWGVTVQGQWGPFGAGYDWVRNRGTTPTNSALGLQPSATGNKLRAGFFYQPGAQISALWMKSQQDNGGALAILAGSAAVANVAFAVSGVPFIADPAATSLTQTAWGLSWEHAFSNVQALAQWAKVSNISGCNTPGACDNTNATWWMLGARYNVSKRTGIYASYSQISNGSNYNMDFFGGWMSSANTGGLPNISGASSGADPRLYGVGIMHNF